MAVNIYNKKSSSESVVIPLDGSKLAEVALPYAEELGARTGGGVYLLSVIAFAGEEHKTYLNRIAGATRTQINKYSAVLGSKEVEVYATTRVGNPAVEIINFAGILGHKLIIMATHGRSGIGRWALGSVADKIVRSATNLPVMLIRGKEARSDMRQKRLLRKALVPLDGSIRSQAVIPYISQLAAKLDMELTLVQVVQKDNHEKAYAESYLQTQCTELEQQGITANYMVEKGSPADEVVNLADELPFDLVAMSTRGKNGIEGWALGSVAQKVLLAGSTPLLLMKN